MFHKSVLALMSMLALVLTLETQAGIIRYDIQSTDGQFTGHLDFDDSTFSGADIIDSLVSFAFQFNGEPLVTAATHEIIAASTFQVDGFGFHFSSFVCAETTPAPGGCASPSRIGYNALSGEVPRYIAGDTILLNGITVGNPRLISVPEPSAFWLFAFGLLPLLGMRGLAMKGRTRTDVLRKGLA